MKKRNATLTMSAIALAMATAFAPAQAADVPAGVELHPVQELIRGNGAEVASLDPNKIEGVPGSNIARDLFETLIVQDLQGNIVPGVAEKWESSNGNKTWTFTFGASGAYSLGPASGKRSASIAPGSLARMNASPTRKAFTPWSRISATSCGR